jgi:RNA polymerase sigma factor (TIGR02999 family)
MRGEILMTSNTGLGFEPALSAEGQEDISGALFAALYTELHRLAKCQIGRQAAPITISPTTLLHRAYIEMADRASISFPDYPRFIGYASRVMRGLIIDHFRNRRAQKRGSLFQAIPWTFDMGEKPVDDQSVLLIDDAMDELTKVAPQLAEVVNLKFFCGFSFAEIAVIRKVSERTVQREWEKARIYLHRSIRPDLLP